MSNRTFVGLPRLRLVAAVAVVAILVLTAVAGAFAIQRSAGTDLSSTRASSSTSPSPSTISATPPGGTPSISVHPDGTPSVTNTLVLFNDSLVSGNFPADYGTEAADVAVDAVTENLYVSDEGTDEVSIIHQVTSVGVEVVGVVPVGSYPMGLAYDPLDQSIYVADWGDGTVDVINGTTSAVGSIDLGGQPISIAFDSHNGDVYVANWNTSVEVINGTTNAIVKVITTGIGGSNGAGSTDGIVFDSGTNQIFVANSYRASPYRSMPVNIINDSSNTVNKTVWVGDAPNSLAYDPGDGDVYVANGDSKNITVIDDATDVVVANYGGFDSPDGITYSPIDTCIFVSNAGNNTVSTWYPGSQNFLYNTTVGAAPAGIIYAQFFGGANLIEVANLDSSNVSILDDSSGYVDYTVSLEAQPFGTAYDSFDHEMFVANYVANGTVQVINDTVNQFTPVAGIPVGHFPVGVAYDPIQDEVFVTNSRSDSVSVISGFNNTVVKTITVGSFPWGIAYDPRQGEVFVANNGGGTVSVINATTLAVTGLVSTGSPTYSPEGLAFDNATDFVYVALYGQHEVALINAADNNLWTYLPAGSGPEWVAFDSDDSEIFVSNYVSGNVTAYRQTSVDNYWVAANITVGSGPTGVAYDAATDQVFVSNSLSDSVSVIDGATGTATGGVSVGGDPYALAVDTGHSTLYVTNFRQGTATILTIPPISGNQTVTFDEQYLPSGATWYVNISGETPLTTTVNGASGTSLSTSLPLGGYTFSAATNWKNYTPSYTGSFTVTASNPPIDISFSPVSSPVYPVYANETGLPSGATWYFNVSGQPSQVTTVTPLGGNTTNVYVPNGTYPWTLATNWKNYSTSTSSGSVTVTGSPQSVTATYTALPATLYPVTFDQSSLLNGVTWYLNVSGETGRSATVTAGGGQSILLDLANGSYPFVASTNQAAWVWDSSLTGTTFVVHGAPLTVPVYFQNRAGPTLYEIEFSETGLPNGDNFTVLIDGRTLSTVAPSTLAIDLANGSYAFSVPDVAPYVANQSSGTLSVTGHAESVGVTFSSSGTTPSSTAPNNYLWIGLGVILAVIIAALFLILILARRRKKKEEPAAAPGTSPESPPSQAPTEWDSTSGSP
jgi:YVTN family beta-propeller protein